MHRLKVLNYFDQMKVAEFFKLMNTDQEGIKLFKPHELSDMAAFEICNQFVETRDFYFGYFDNDKMLGYALLRTFNKYKTPSLGLYLLPEYRGCGYGRDIVKQLLNFAIYHFDDIMLSVMKNNIVAISLYNSMGFTQLKETEDRLFYYKKL